MDEWLNAEARLAGIGTFGQIGGAVAGDFALVAVLVLGVPLLRSGVLSSPELTLAALTALTSFEAFGGVPAAFAGLFGVLASADRLFTLLDRKPVVIDPSAPALLPRKFDLRLDRVGLVYPGAGRAALDDVDLYIAEGARIALMGASGAGKSSLADLLLRFRDPTHGEIRLGGAPLPDLAMDDIRSRICVVTQSPHLFSATVAENLRLARSDATEPELWAALATAQLEETVRAFPHGLETHIGVAGARLSGGEARRLALARALLTEAKILVLDEPTEGLDAETAQCVLNGVFQHAVGKTVLLLTHQTAGLERMDEIVTLAAGAILSRTMLSGAAQLSIL